MTETGAIQRARPNEYAFNCCGRGSQIPGLTATFAQMCLYVPAPSVDQLTWAFLDMSDEGGKIAIMWDRMLAVAPFDVGDESSRSQ
mgnify:CR=1 FL=1